MSADIQQHYYSLCLQRQCPLRERVSADVSMRQISDSITIPLCLQRQWPL